jgi:lipopolysaccharide/colanic/teichoic acid biosynthesis glycosyltransferase
MIPERPHPNRDYAGKRALDLALLAIGALPVALVAIACAVAVRLSGPGPIIFRQERIGRDGEPFVPLKFRTMIDGPNPLFPDDSRITPVGRILRRTSLDELPQLVNVLRGEMSIVGPRPALAYQVERYDARQLGRLAVRPGLTGLAQVNGRNSLIWAERIEWDLAYIARQSARLDLRIVARTIAVVGTGGGVGGHPTVDPISEIPTDDAAG